MPLASSVSLNKSIAFTTDQSGESPTCVSLQFTPDTLTRIAKVQILVKKNDLFSAKIEIPDKVKLLNEAYDGDELPQPSDWRYDFATFIVFPDSFYFFAQNKWDSACQIESDEITLEEIYPLFNINQS